ncbi:MAG: ribbon-helix-helix protein, CopG family [Alphaproteobacteria bacterium]|nr:ribbon-helix-helix protein, CopG family [Alphaproteobacteria bacterium]MBV9151180.1 ribbon-helix-helix protein, CopG family [Alphaproteobacteria bacterium]MBV9585470.1 ribbon-helix-helix protein, CopG family [Alphaproteobacteria bacterium]MBV9964268.1 ribbon-helix-helix protein, CopG family [Alphaproteobacteria bacterium]
MRTTLTIEDDVAAELERLRRDRDASLKDVVNEALRRGVRDMTAPPKRAKPFRTKSYDCGRLLIDNIDNVWEVLDQIEDEKFR